MFLYLFLLFVTVPLLELYLLLLVGRYMGLFPTLALVLGTGFLGAWLAQSQGASTFARIRQDLDAGRMPTDSLADALLILIAGAVLLTPGLLTDAAGFFLLVPPGRRWVRGRLRRAFARHLRARTVHHASSRTGGVRIDFGQDRGGPDSRAGQGPRKVVVVEDYRIDEAPSEDGEP